jgi:signal transduction histidine kinase
MPRDQSVGRLLTRAFAGLVLVIICSGLAETVAILLQHRVVRQLTAHVQPLELANAQLRVVLADAQRGLRGYLLTGDTQLLDTYSVARSDYPVAVADVRDLAAGDETRPVDGMVARAATWWALAEQQRRAAPGSAAAVRYVVQDRPLFDAFVGANDEVDLALAARTASLRRESAQLGVLSVASVVALTVAGAVFAAVTARRMTRLTLVPGRGGDREQSLVARLQELETAKTDFLSTVSHELRTPLTSISGYVELLLDGDAGQLNTGQERMVEVIVRNTRRLRELIEDMLTLSKIESGAFRTTKREVDLTGLVENALAAIGPAAAKASVGLRCEVYGPLTLAADPEQIDRILSNLLANAIKFTPPNGTVTVTGRREGEDVVIVVADTGMGIPEAEQQALFARFFRASNAIHQAVPGTGLGLAIVRTIVDNHGGRIDVDSTEGVGTTVAVRLPADA